MITPGPVVITVGFITVTSLEFATEVGGVYRSTTVAAAGNFSPLLPRSPSFLRFHISRNMRKRPGLVVVC